MTTHNSTTPRSTRATVTAAATISTDAEGNISCTCPSFRFSRALYGGEGGYCSHVAAAKIAQARTTQPQEVH
jgi:hypothetical protein